MSSLLVTLGMKRGRTAKIKFLFYFKREEQEYSGFTHIAILLNIVLKGAGEGRPSQYQVHTIDLCITRKQQKLGNSIIVLVLIERVSQVKIAIIYHTFL